MKTTYETRCGMAPRIHEMKAGKPLYKYVSETRPDCVISWGYIGIGIWLADNYGDECIAAWGSGSGWDKAARHAINYTATGRAYIRKGGRRFYLDEAMVA